MNSEFKNEIPIKIFSTDGKGINLIQNPVKVKIISYLLNSESNSLEIAKFLDKSKSTVSFHLNSLLKLGIVNFRIDPEDNRKKIFFIDSKFLGEINPSSSEDLEEIKINYIIEDILDVENFKFSILLFNTLKSIFIREGININPLLEEAGRYIGFAIYDKVYDNDIHKFVKNVENFWEDNGMGNLEIILGEIIQINNKNCFECSLLPKIGESSCFLDKGIIWALFSSYLDFEVIVDEFKCYSKNDEFCSFYVKLTNIPFTNLSKTIEI